MMLYFGSSGLFLCTQTRPLSLQPCMKLKAEGTAAETGEDGLICCRYQKKKKNPCISKSVLIYRRAVERLIQDTPQRIYGVHLC